MVTKVNTTVIDSTNANVSFATTANNSSFLGGSPAANYAALSGATFTGNVTTSANVKFTGWQIYETGTTLYFAYNGAVKMSLNTNGNLTVTGDVAGFGTP